MAAQLDDPTRIDHTTHEALVAIDASSGGGVGVARLVRDANDAKRADVVDVVVDEWQHRGVGGALAERLATRAKALGVEPFTARMLVGNDAARRLVEHAGIGVRADEEDGTLLLTAKPRAEAARIPQPLAVTTRPRRNPIRLALSRLAGYRGQRSARLQPAHQR